MIIFYGTRSGQSDKRLATPCGNCQQPALVQTDWYRYFHLMFIPTFPVGKDRSVHCQACGNSYDTKGSAPIWTFIGSVIIVLCVLGSVAQQAIKRYGVRGSIADIADVTSDPSSTAATPAASSAPTPPVAAAPPPPVAASSKAGAPAAAGKAGKKKKK
jgi:hypothetical protein